MRRFLSDLVPSMQRLWALDKFAYSVRVLIALTGVTLLCGWLQRIDLVMPMYLGIIASALAETDDHWLGRLKALIVTLSCFVIAGFSVELLLPYPTLFAIGMVSSTFVMTMLGAAGERYATITFATLTLAIYTMIGVEQRGDDQADWVEPLLLIGAATWYGLISVAWNAIFAVRPVQQATAEQFGALGDYLSIKSQLFEPSRHLDVEERRLALARQNGIVVDALNRTKTTILSRLKHGRARTQIRRYLKLYFIAQDIHERASSSHYPYSRLIDAFFHSDVLFRCQRLLAQQAKACHTLGHAVRLRQPFDYNDNESALADLTGAIVHLRQQNNPSWRGLLRSLNALVENLDNLDRKLSGASNPDALAEEQDSNLSDHSPRTWKEGITRIRQQLTFSSLLFRHALRMTIALLAGYGVLHWLYPEQGYQGYWILLTTLFVCRPGYGATRRRLVQRIAGTLLGLIGGWALIELFPDPLLQSLLTIAAGVLFFAYRTTRYTLATAGMTILILFCFNQIGDGYDLILPRLIDTLIGCAIAGLSVLFILPDWQGRQLNLIMGNTLRYSSEYLRQIMLQYDLGKHDNMAYRIARRDAHNADATLSTTLANILMEPGHFRKDAEAGFRFLVLSHTLLGYLSALGAHRHQWSAGEIHAELDRTADFLATQLETLGRSLIESTWIDVNDTRERTLADSLEKIPDDIDDTQRLVRTQLALIGRLLARLRTLAAHLVNSRQKQITTQPLSSDDDSSF